MYQEQTYQMVGTALPSDANWRTTKQFAFARGGLESVEVVGQCPTAVRAANTLVKDKVTTLVAQFSDARGRYYFRC